MPERQTATHDQEAQQFNNYSNLEEAFKRQLVEACSKDEYTNSYHVVVRLGVCSTTTSQDPTRQVLDIQIPINIFFTVENTGMLLSRHKYENSTDQYDNDRSGAEDLTFVRVLQAAVRGANGLELEMIDDQMNSIEITSVLEVRVVKGGMKDGYHVSLLSEAEKLVWLHAEGGWNPPQPTLALGQPMNNRVSSICPLRYFLATDYTIYLKSDDTGEILSTFSVNRFLLGLRIPYYRVMFSSGMADSETSSSNLYTDTFTAEALTVICRYIYMTTDSMESLFWFSGLPGASTDETTVLKRNIANYISPGICEDKKTSLCEKYAESGGAPLSASIMTHIIDVIKAADYLGLDDLKSYMLCVLARMAHEFDCYGQGCSMLLPKILNAVYGDQNIPMSVTTRIVSMLGQAKAVLPLWKRPLLMMRPEVLNHLVAKIKDRILYEPDGKRSNDGGGALGAFRLYIALARLRRQVGARSKDAINWDEKLLGPLLDFCMRVLVADWKWCEHIVSRGTSSMYMDIIQELLEEIAGPKFMRRENCEKVWRVVRDTTLEFWCEKAEKGALEWFRSEWLSLSVTPPEPDPRTSARPIPSVPHSVNTTPRVPRMKEAYEPNFFATWDRGDLEALGKELDVDIEDLLAQGHRAGLPPRTPRRSIGKGVMRKRDLVRTELDENDAEGVENEVAIFSGQGRLGGAAEIPPTGGGRTVEADGATLLNGELTSADNEIGNILLAASSPAGRGRAAVRDTPITPRGLVSLVGSVRGRGAVIGATHANTITRGGPSIRRASVVRGTGLSNAGSGSPAIRGSGRAEAGSRSSIVVGSRSGSNRGRGGESGAAPNTSG